MSRRTIRFTLGASAVALALAISGCASVDADADADASDSASKEMTLVTWGSSFQDAQQASAIDPFQEETGIDVTVDSPVDFAKLRVMVESGAPTWDVYVSDPNQAIGYCDELFEPIDLSGIDQSQFPEGMVTDCGIPWDTFSYVLAYNTNTFGDAQPTSALDLFDVEKYPGMRAVPSYDGQGIVELALISDGVSYEDLYPLDLDRAYKVLDTIKDKLIFFDTGATQAEIMQSERADLVLGWSGRSSEAVTNGAPYAPAWESNVYQWATLSVVKGSPHADAAQKFVQFSAGAEVQGDFAELTSYGPANTESVFEMTDIRREWEASLPEHRDQSISVDYAWWAENADEATERWVSWTTG